MVTRTAESQREIECLERALDAARAREIVVIQIAESLIGRSDAIRVCAGVLSYLAIETHSVTDPRRCDRLVRLAHQVVTADHLTGETAEGEVVW